MVKELLLVEMGVLLTEKDEDYNQYTSFYGVENFHLYEENMWFIFKNMLNKEKEYLKKILKKCVNNTYMIISNQGLWHMEEDDDLSDLDLGECDFSKENVIYSIMKDSNGNIIENFIH